MRLISFVLCAAMWCGSTGCAALVVGAAGGAAGAVYVMGRLQERVQAPVPTVHHAAVQGLKDLDLPILEDKGDKITAHLESEFADSSHVWIDLDTVGESQTKITIRVGIVGDEARSRRLLAVITKRLPESSISGVRDCSSLCPVA
jgi:hypothetical protein